ARARRARGLAEPGVRGPGRPGARGSEQRLAQVAPTPPRREREAWTPPDDRQVLYGRNAVHEALRGPRTVEHVWATSSAAQEPWLAEAQGGGMVDVNVVTDNDWIERRCGSPDHQGVCAQVQAFRYAYVDELLRVHRPLIVALDEIQDPQNLGAIVRTAECAGATGVVMPERRAAEVTPAVCKASAGAVEHMPIAQVRNLADFLAAASAAGCWRYGAEGAGGRPYTQVDYAGAGVVLVLGSEGRGLRPRVAANCDALIALPLRGQIESLNVSAAASALVYEIVRQRDAAKRG
ncbi:23S rRNA (guanosine(2251)-2'-O)-methyltransferase RlmB, partial [Conexibacter sp. JD483]|uniref:23S rRNA (guanosine(2251)-2'-O)-methyltransferase RlmB n=3 Tax=unclassified Conexibacter TaxID=2627773 RepID=UPI00286FE84D